MLCKECSKQLSGKQEIYCSEYCQNKKYVRSAKKNSVQKRREYVSELKRKPCTDCGLCYHPYVMDFDHVRGLKTHHVSQMVQRGWQALLDEIDKCELVCANCHRMRTLSRRGVT